jgi:hypothetical protein
MLQALLDGHLRLTYSLRFRRSDFTRKAMLACQQSKTERTRCNRVYAISLQSNANGGKAPAQSRITGSHKPLLSLRWFILPPSLFVVCHKTY